MAYCPYDGRLARWPKHDPTTCTMRCAAERTMIELTGSGDGTWHCMSCGREAVDQDCDNPKCPDYGETREYY